MIRNSVLRTTTLVPLTAARRTLPTGRLVCAAQQARGAHAISNPTLANIEKRWEDMPPQEQAELWMQLRDRMKVDWKELTLQEKKAGTQGTPPRRCFGVGRRGGLSGCSMSWGQPSPATLDQLPLEV